MTPAGKTKIRNCRSMKKLGHAVGWCSETEAMIGMYLKRADSEARPR